MIGVSFPTRHLICAVWSALVFAGCAQTPQVAPATTASSAPTSPAATPASAPTAQATTRASGSPPIPVAGLNALGGRIFNIEPGIGFNTLAGYLQPGDEVRLLPGVHIPFELVDLRGEPNKPIVIRGYQLDADKPLPYVKGEIFCVSLVRPRNVIVRDMLLGNSTGPTVFIDGSLGASPVVEEGPWEANLMMTNLSIRQDGAADSQSSLYMRSIQKADVTHIAIKGWNSSAIVLDNCQKIGITQCVLDTVKNLPQYRGVAIRSGCEDISCMYLSFGTKVQVVFELGVCDTTSVASGSEASQRPAQRILISHNAALDTQCFVSLGSVDNSDIVSNSIIECTKFVWRADGMCGVPNSIVFENNLVTWVPGRIDRISAVAAGIPPESIHLQKNLWWSEELPAAFAVVGKPFGVELAPQVFDVDPKVEMHGFAPVEVRARSFGWSSVETKTPAAAPKTP